MVTTSAAPLRNWRSSLTLEVSDPCSSSTWGLVVPPKYPHTCLLLILQNCSKSRFPKIRGTYTCVPWNPKHVSRISWVPPTEDVGRLSWEKARMVVKRQLANQIKDCDPQEIFLQDGYVAMPQLHQATHKLFRWKIFIHFNLATRVHSAFSLWSSCLITKTLYPARVSFAYSIKLLWPLPMLLLSAGAPLSEPCPLHDSSGSCHMM